MHGDLVSGSRFNSYDCVVIGAGPAGLSAAYILSKHGKKVIVLESDPKYVGGISKTVEFDGFRCDIGGHRFFSKSQEIEDFWDEIMPAGILTRQRSSRIFYKGKFFSYPLKGSEALFKLGIFSSILAVLSYFKAKLFPITNAKSFEDWVSNNFGKHLYKIFFKSYTEKVWGIPCNEISADWAAQRIKGLSLIEAIKNAFFKKSKDQNRNEVVKTLIDSFRYPKFGPGQMWESAAEKITSYSSRVVNNQRVVELSFSESKNEWLCVARSKEGVESQYYAKEVINTSSLKDLVNMFDKNDVGETVLTAVKQLHYRDFITVAIAVEDKDIFHDQWIYIHDPEFTVGRIQNFKSWSPYMVPDQKYNCYGLEYFCHKGDRLWGMNDQDLVDLAKGELEKLGLSKRENFFKAHVIRQPKAYPVYDENYKLVVSILRKEFLEKWPGLHTIGRNGMHMYNNQDHSMMTAILVAKNILQNANIYDEWKVNQDAEYHEAVSTETPSKGKIIPSRL